MNDDNPSRRGATMIDQELPKRAQKARRKPQTRGLGSPGPPWAFEDLPHAANRRMIALQEPASGKCRFVRPSAPCWREKQEKGGQGCSF
jgi:hypothetical protein